jgi:hypothetical protein
MEHRRHTVNPIQFEALIVRLATTKRIGFRAHFSLKRTFQQKIIEYFKRKIYLKFFRR